MTKERDTGWEVTQKNDRLMVWPFHAIVNAGGREDDGQDAWAGAGGGGG